VVREHGLFRESLETRLATSHYGVDPELKGQGSGSARESIMPIPHRPSFDRFLLVLLTISTLANFCLVWKLNRERAITHAPLLSARDLTPVERAEVEEPGAPARGPVSAPVTLVLFTDFRCPYCRQFARTLNSVEQTEGDRIHLIVRQLPLAIHPGARSNAELALCAKEQNENDFWIVYQFFYSQESAVSTEQGIRYLSSRPEINLVRLQSCMGDHRSLPEIDADVTLAAKYGVKATPTLFINGSRLVGVASATDLMRAIDSKLSSSGQVSPKYTNAEPAGHF
jgi:protein-disulfide isomerase